MKPMALRLAFRKKAFITPIIAGQSKQVLTQEKP